MVRRAMKHQFFFPKSVASFTARDKLSEVGFEMFSFQFLHKILEDVFLNKITWDH